MLWVVGRCGCSVTFESDTTVRGGPTSASYCIRWSICFCDATLQSPIKPSLWIILPCNDRAYGHHYCMSCCSLTEKMQHHARPDLSYGVPPMRMLLIYVSGESESSEYEVFHGRGLCISGP